MEECGRMNVLFAAFAGNKSVVISAEEIGWTSFYEGSFGASPLSPLQPKLSCFVRHHGHFSNHFVPVSFIRLMSRLL